MVFIISVVLDFDHLKISVPQLNASIKVRDRKSVV